MKKTHINLVLLLLFFLGCSENETANVSLSYVKFVHKTLTIPYTGGESLLLIESCGTPWEIVYDKDNDLISDILQTKGGELGDVKQYTQIKFRCNENLTKDIRSQELFLINEITGERSSFTLIQDTKYKPLLLSIDKSTEYQTIVGFGGMYNPKIWLSKNDLITESEITKMYDSNQLGYNVLRLMIYPNELDWISDIDAAKRAQELGAIIFASPWEIPAHMSEEINVNGKLYDRHLKPDSYQEYANHLVKYIKFMKDNGVDLYAVSVQNEPDMDFTFWYPHEIVNFIKKHGNQIKEAGVKLMAPEACGFQPEYTDPVLNDAEAFDKTDILAGHTYQGFIDIEESSYVKNRYDYICSLYNKKLAASGKTWWMTEHLFNEGEKESDSSKWEFQKWKYNLSTLGKEIHMCMDGYCSAYIYWYLKRFYGMIGDSDNRSLEANGEVLKNGYILSHYAKYATGTIRININTGDLNVLGTAYLNRDNNEVSIVLINLTNDDLNVSIPLSGIKEIDAIETTEEKNMEKAITGELNESDGAYVLVSKSSITSIRLNL